MNTQDNTRLITAAELGKRFSLGLWGIRKMAARGQIRQIVIGPRVIRYDWPEVCKGLGISEEAAK